MATYQIGDTVRVVNPNYPAVSGLTGKITNIDQHLSDASLWLYEVTFPQHYDVILFSEKPPALVQESHTAQGFSFDDLAPVEDE